MIPAAEAARLAVLARLLDALRRKPRSRGQRVEQPAQAQAYRLRKRRDIVPKLDRLHAVALERQEQRLGYRRAPQERVHRELDVLARRLERFSEPARVARLVVDHRDPAQRLITAG